MSKLKAASKRMGKAHSQPRGVRRLVDAENRAAVAEKKLSFAVAGLQDIADGNWKCSARRAAKITLDNVKFFGGLMNFDVCMAKPPNDQAHAPRKEKL